MTERTVIAGSGGQGAILAGKVLAQAAMLDGREVTFFPSYGTEVRGGTANCSVTVSDKKIASPVASNPDVLVAMNSPSLDKFEPTIAKGGLIFLNASLMPETPSRTDVNFLQVPTVELAKEVGNARGGNMVMIGAVCAKTGLLSLEETIKGMQAAMKGKDKFFEANQKAIERGFAFAADGK